jgi:HAD superfamily hydrolase (TIGR01509 family)
MIRGVIFDLDGTLFEADYDWPEIKRKLGVPAPGGSILHHLESLPPKEQARKRALLEGIEDRATREGRLREGALELLALLRRHGLKLALVTNNRDDNVREILDRYGLRFEVVMTRDSGLFKPSGDPLRLAATQLGLEPAQLAAVGDSEFDLRAGNEAEIGVVILVNSDPGHYEGRFDHAVHDLDQLRSLFVRILAPPREPD